MVVGRTELTLEIEFSTLLGSREEVLRSILLEVRWPCHVAAASFNPSYLTRDEVDRARESFALTSDKSLRSGFTIN